MRRESDVSNALVAQKDRILNALNARPMLEPEEYAAVMDDLELAAPLWRALDYGYKLVELLEAVRDRCVTRIADEEEFIQGERKNGRARRQAETEVRQCNQILRRIATLFRG